MESVQVGYERQAARGWSYAVSVRWAGGRISEHEVTLSHHDYEHWCGGVEPPSRVVERGARIAGEALGTGLPARFDLSQMRRRIDRFDERMRDG